MLLFALIRNQMLKWKRGQQQLLSGKGGPSHLCPCFSYADRSQDSSAVGLSDSNSSQDIFMELGSPPDSTKKTSPEGRPLASCSDLTAPGKESLAPTEDRGKLGKAGAFGPCARERKAGAELHACSFLGFCCKR